MLSYFNIRDDSFSSSRLIMAMMETLLAARLLSLIIMLTSWQLAPVLTKSSSSSCEFLAKLPRAAAALDLIFSSLSFNRDTSMGMAIRSWGYSCASWKPALPRAMHEYFLMFLSSDPQCRITYLISSYCNILGQKQDECLHMLPSRQSALDFTSLFCDRSSCLMSAQGSIDSMCSQVYLEDLATWDNKLRLQTKDEAQYWSDLSRLNLTNRDMPPNQINCCTKFILSVLKDNRWPRNVITAGMDSWLRCLQNQIISIANQFWQRSFNISGYFSACCRQTSSMFIVVPRRICRQAQPPPQVAGHQATASICFSLSSSIKFLMKAGCTISGTALELTRLQTSIRQAIMPRGDTSVLLDILAISSASRAWKPVTCVPLRKAASFYSVLASLVISLWQHRNTGSQYPTTWMPQLEPQMLRISYSLLLSEPDKQEETAFRHFQLVMDSTILFTYGADLQSSSCRTSKEPNVERFPALGSLCSSFDNTIDITDSGRYYLSMKSSSFFLSRKYFRMCETIKHAVLQITWSGLASVPKICFNISLGPASKFSVNSFDSLSDCRTTLCTDIFDRLLAASSRSSTLAKNPAQSISSNPLTSDCFTQSTIVANQLQSVMPPSSVRRHGKHQISPQTGCMKALITCTNILWMLMLPGYALNTVIKSGMNLVSRMSLQKENERKQWMEALLANMPTVRSRFIVRV